VPSPPGGTIDGSAKGLDQQRGGTATLPPEAETAPAYGRVTAREATAYRRSMDPSTSQPGTVSPHRAIVNSSAQDAQTPVTGTRRRPPGGPFTRWPRAADAVLALAVFIVVLVVSPDGPDGEITFRSVDEVSIADLLILAVGSGLLYWRRSKPLIVLWVTLGVSFLSIGFGDADTVGIAMMFALYSVGRYVTNDRWGYTALGGALAFVTISSLASAEVPAAIGFGLFLTFFVWYVGRRLRIRGEHAEQLEREHAAEARRAVAEERTRIARELHDVVAHRVSLMTVQAGAAKTVAADDPESAALAMHAVEKAGRQALDELRHLLGVLRPEADGETLGPQPGLADVPQLVDQFRAAGLDASLTIDGEQVDLPARVDLSAYRIVQEALTNALKHAGSSARTEVRLHTDDRGVDIEVLDDSRGVTILTGSGHGILGMRERALLLGGRLDVGPRPGGGFQVVAHLPIRAEPA
jgi:signal transduction histidine kinase